MNRLSGKVCLITGSGGSMGRAAALWFASEGATVIGCDLSVSGAEATLDQVQAAGGNMVSMQPCDLTDQRQCQELVQFALSNCERIDVLYNNAAMAYFGWVAEMPVSDWNKTINEELNLVWLLTQAAWPELTNGE